MDEMENYILLYKKMTWLLKTSYFLLFHTVLKKKFSNYSIITNIFSRYENSILYYIFP
jgi:hypothetical protein